MRDAALILSARGGDELAFRRLLKRHGWLVDFHASRYFAPGCTADDLRQEGLIGFHKAVRDYRPGHGSGFRNFAEICVTRQIITAVKMATRKKHAPLNERADLAPDSGEDEETDHLTVYAAPDADPAEIVGRCSRIRDLAESARATPLTELEDAAITMLAEGMSYEVMAAELGMSEKVIDNALQRARRKIATALDAA